MDSKLCRVFAPLIGALSLVDAVSRSGQPAEANSLPRKRAISSMP